MKRTTSRELEQAWIAHEVATYRDRTLPERLQDFKEVLDLVAVIQASIPHPSVPTPPKKTFAEQPWWPPREPLILPHP